MEHVVQFDAKRGTLPGLEMQLHALGNQGSLRGCCTGAAWLSSARGVSCWVKSPNERNPCRVLKYSLETARFKREEGRDDVKSAWSSDDLGYTRATMGCHNGLRSRKAELIPPNHPSVRIEGCNSPS